MINEFVVPISLMVVWVVSDSHGSLGTDQPQKTQGFCVADFVTLCGERRLRSKIVLLFNTDKRTLSSKI